MQKKSTYLELARLAQVSPATVSRVAAGRHSVNPEIKQRVEAAATQLGVDLQRKRNEAGRMLAFFLSNRELLHSFHSRVLAGAESFASDHGWELVFLVYRYPHHVSAEELHLPQILHRRMPPRGVLLAGMNSPNLLQALHRRGVPFSVLGNNLLGPGETPPCDQVWSNDVQGAFDQTQYLISLGHRAIWFVGNTRYPWFSRCSQGYHRAMTGAGLEPRLCEMHSDGHELGYLAAKSILARGEPVTAIFAGSDEAAGGVIAALRESEIAVPRHLSVVGFNDCAAAMLYPALTSVREFPEKLGYHLAEFTVNRINRPATPVQHLTIPTQLVVRQSAGAPLVAADPPSAPPLATASSP